MAPRKGEADLGVAVIQMEPRIGETKANVEKTVRLIKQAHKSGAELIVLPELCNTGYVFESRAEATALAEEVPDGETCRSWLEVCAALGIHLVAGITERDGVKLYNSAVVIGFSLTKELISLMISWALSFVLSVCTGAKTRKGRWPRVFWI